MKTTSQKSRISVLLWTAVVLVFPFTGLTQTTNRVLSLDGNGDYVSIPSAPDLQNPNGITIEAWLYPVINPAEKNPHFLAKSDGLIAWSQRSYELNYVTNSWNTSSGGMKIEFSIYLGASNWVVLGVPFEDRRWVHVAATYASQAGIVSLYTNGILGTFTTTNVAGPLAGQTVRQTAWPVYLGTFGNAGGFASGAMDEVRIWTKARTPDEIYRDRFCRLIGSESNLAAYWTFDDGTANDLTGRGHNGTFAGNAQASPVEGRDFVHDGPCGVAQPPVITWQPQSQTAWVGSDVTLSLMAFGSPAPSYQWRKGASNLLGSTSASLSLTNLQPSDAGNYDVVLTSPLGSVTSIVAALTVLEWEAVRNGGFEESGGDGTVPTGWSVITNSYGAWRAMPPGRPPHGDSWVLLVGDAFAEGGQYQDISTLPGQAYRLSFWAVGWLNGGSPQTGGIQVGTPGSAPADLAQNNHAEYLNDLFQVPLFASSASWTRFTYTFTPTSETSRITFQNVATATANGVSVDDVQVTPLVAPIINRVSQSQMADWGSNFTLTLHAVGTEPLSYQWYCNGSLLADATNAALTLTSVTTNQSGSYQAVVANEIGSATSAVAELVVRHWNRVLTLDGEGDYATVPSAVDLQNPAEITIEAWIYPQQASQNNALFVNKGDSASGNSSRTYELQWVANADSAGPGRSVRFVVFLGTASWAWVGAAPAAQDEWVHVAACFSSSQGVLQLFTNGILAAISKTDAGGSLPLTGTLLRQTTLPVRLGRSDYPPYNYARGYMDEVRIWTKARSADEIYRDRFCKLTGTEPNLAGYWTFDDGTASDATGHGHNGTFSGNAQGLGLTGEDWVHAGLCGDVLPHYELLATTAGGGILTPDPLLSSFPAYGIVTLTATPMSGWTFLDWKGSTQGLNPVTTLRMNCDKLAEARFGTALTVTPSGSGTVSLIPASSLYPCGSSVRVVAQPQPGSYFTGWSGSASGDANPLTLAVRDANPAVVASFASLPAGRLALTIIPEGSGRVVVTPRANSFTNGQTVTLRARPDAGQDFLGWSGDASGTDLTNVITMTESKVITASFTERPSLDIQSLGADGVLLTLTGEFSGAYRILTSTDLTDWTLFLSLTNAFGEAQVIDPPSTNQWRFFRAVMP